MDEHGVPLSLIVTGANVHDVKILEETLDGKIIKPKRKRQQNLCADKGYFGKPAKKAIESRGHIAHVRSRGEEKKALEKKPGYKPRRWVVEVCHSWFNRFRKILVRYEKTKESYEALNHLAAAIICYRKIGIIYG